MTDIAEKIKSIFHKSPPNECHARFWIKAEDNPSWMKYESNRILCDAMNGRFQMTVIKIDELCILSARFPGHGRTRIAFNLTDVLGDDIFFAMNAHEGKITEMYLNAERVEFVEI